MDATQVVVMEILTTTVVMYKSLWPLRCVCWFLFQEGKSGIERELGRLQGLLKKKYANPADSGYTYVANDGEKVLLTPSMMSEWARAVVCSFCIALAYNT